VAVSSAALAGFIVADWPVPAHVHAGVTTRAGGVSLGGYSSLNLGDHVGDDPTAVAENRHRLAHSLRLPDDPKWLAQVHGTNLVRADEVAGHVEADGAWTAAAGSVCAVLTADCLPVLLCDRDGRQVAAVHAGWRGLAAGVLQEAVATFTRNGIAAGQLFAWMGPAVSARNYEVDAAVYEAMCSPASAAVECFNPVRDGHWLCDLYALARFVLKAEGVQSFFGSEYCTYEQGEFFSYRREPICGRQASLIWLDPAA